MKKLLAVGLGLLWVVAGIGSVGAQVLNVGETLGAGKKAVFAAGNRLFIDGDELNITYVQFIYGANKRLDLYATLGGTRIFRQDQAWVGVGANLHLFRLEKFDVSTYNVVSFPLHRRREASTLLLNTMLVVSRSVSKNLTLYSGVNALVPVGALDRGLFTPTEKKINVPIGAAIARGPWTLFLEADIGHLKAIGAGLVRTF
jgi:hypothetical protein